MTTLKVGDPAPGFALQQHGETVRLEDYRGKKLLVYFYPEADTPGCTVSRATSGTTGRTSRDRPRRRRHLPGRPEKQLSVRREVPPRVPAARRRAPEVATAWGTWVEKHRGGHTYMGILRSSFLVDEEGRIEQAWSPVTPEDTVPNAIAAIAVECPARRRSARLDFLYVPSRDVAAGPPVVRRGPRWPSGVRDRLDGDAGGGRRAERDPPLVLLRSPGGRSAGASSIASPDLNEALDTLEGRGWRREHRFEIPHGPICSFEGPGGHRVALYQLTRPEVAAHFEGRRDF